MRQDTPGNRWIKRRFWRLGLVVLLTVSGSLTGFFVVNNARVGKELDQFRGIKVYHNGFLFFRSHGRHYAGDGYYYGQKWQCVEFIKRFYHDALQHKMPDVMGHARSFFDATLSDGAVNSRRGLVQYRNGSAQRPRLNDLMVFTDTKYGHVGIVTEVNETTVEIIQQNILGHTRQRFSIAVTNAHYFITSPRMPAGWLRLPDPA